MHTVRSDALIGPPHFGHPSSSNTFSMLSTSRITRLWFGFKDFFVDASSDEEVTELSACIVEAPERDSPTTLTSSGPTSVTNISLVILCIVLAALLGLTLPPLLVLVAVTDTDTRFQSSSEDASLLASKLCFGLDGMAFILCKLQFYCLTFPMKSESRKLAAWRSWIEGLRGI
jgi:hypothetical protein